MSKELKNKGNIIPVCSVCGKVDSVKGDGHSCFDHIQQKESNEYYW